MKKILFTILSFLAVVILPSCTYRSNDKIRIVTTLYPQYQFTKALIGHNYELTKHFDVSLIIPPGADTHSFDPSIADIVNLKTADLVIYTGDDMEVWISRISVSDETVILNLSEDERIIKLEVEEHDHEDEEVHQHHDHDLDPHYWVYPIYATYMVEQICDALINLLKQNALDNKIATIRDNAANYIGELEKIDLAIKQVIDVAKVNELYFGTPFTFYYWMHYYELEYVLTYETCSTEVDPSIVTIIQIINQMKENNIKVIYVKELLSTAAAEMIARHTGAKILLLHSCHNVSKEDFHNPDVSYLSLMSQNVFNLAEGLNVDIDALVEFSLRGEK